MFQNRVHLRAKVSWPRLSAGWSWWFRWRPHFLVMQQDIVACQGAGVSVKPVTRTPTRHTLGPFSPLNRWNQNSSSHRSLQKSLGCLVVCQGGEVSINPYAPIARKSARPLTLPEREKARNNPLVGCIHEFQIHLNRLTKLQLTLFRAN